MKSSLDISLRNRFQRRPFLPDTLRGVPPTMSTKPSLPLRRDFLKATMGATAFLASGRLVRGGGKGSSRASQARASDTAWGKMPEILARIKPPQFPKRDFD